MEGEGTMCKVENICTGSEVIKVVVPPPFYPLFLFINMSKLPATMRDKNLGEWIN